MGHRRHAVYWTPPPGPLSRLGAAWLGWDPARGEGVPHPDVPGLPRPAVEITEAPRRYGLHATLGPPMRLAEGAGEGDLDQVVEALAAGLAPARAEGLRVARLDGFVALVPDGDGAALGALAAEVVRALDPLRAPAGAEELARRRAAGLSAREEALLVRWGYPYVMEAFRFHATLSGRLSDADAAAVEAALAPMLAPGLPRPFVLGEIALMGEGDDGLFREIRRYRLGG